MNRWSVATGARSEYRRWTKSLGLGPGRVTRCQTMSAHMLPTGGREGGKIMGILAITLQDLRFRARQFLIAVVGAGLVFSMGLLLTGLVTGVTTEINQTVQAVGADAWVLATGGAARIAALSPLPSSAVPAVAAEPGVTRADPIIVAPQAARAGATTLSIIMIGTQPGGLGATTVTAGHGVRANGQAVVDSGLSVPIGGHFTV